MPTKIPPEKWQVYFQARDIGQSQRNAAAVAGIAVSTCERMEQGSRAKGNMTARKAYLESGIGPVKRLGQVNQEAKKALKDFGLFRKRYFGRVASPWQEDAGYKVAELMATGDREYAVINCPPGSGKALAVDTPIPTPTHWTTIKDLKVGDQVIGSDGHPTTVVAKSEVFYDHDCYLVESDDGASVIADADHLWDARLHGHGQYKRVRATPGTRGPARTTREGIGTYTTAFLAQPRSKKPQLAVTPIHYATQELPIDPYTLGVWLGDGNSDSARFTCHPDDAPHITERITDAGYTVERKGEMRYSITGSAKWIRDGLQTQLRAEGLLGRKHIPVLYLRSSTAQRLALLQGLIDTDGHIDSRGQVEFCNTDYLLAYDVQMLARSLGVKASLNEDRATLYGKDCGPRYRVCFYLAGAASLPRKAVKCRKGVRTPHRYLTVTPTESVPTQCIQIAAPDGLYLAGLGMLLTHNSTLFTHDLLAWLLVRDRGLRILVGSATQSLARSYVNRLRNTFERVNPPAPSMDLIEAGLAVDAVSTLLMDFGKFKPTNSSRWRDDEFVIAQHNDDTSTDKESSVTAYGRDSGILGGRFDLCLWDDLVDRKTLRSSDARAKLEEDFDNELETRLEPRGLFLLQGQRMGPGDLYRYALDKKGAPPVDEEGFDVEVTELPAKYHHIVYPAHDELKCTGAHPRNLPAWPRSCLLEPTRLDWKMLKRVQTANDGRYRTVYQQEDQDPASLLVDLLWIKGGIDSTTGVKYVGCWDTNRKMGQWPANLAGHVGSIACVDPSGERYWGATHWATQDQTDTDHLVQLSRSHMMAGQLLDQLQDGTFVGLMEDWQQASRQMGHPITHWIVEINAAQRYLLQYRHVTDWQRSRQVLIIPHATHRNRSDPDRGVETLGNYFKHGQVRLPAGDIDSKLASHKLVTEATMFPQGPSTDLLMSYWFLRFNLPNLRRKNTTREPAPRPAWLNGGVHLTPERHLFAVNQRGTG